MAECEVLRNNALINIHMAHTAAEMGVAHSGAEEGGAEGQGSRGAREQGKIHLCTFAP